MPRGNTSRLNIHCFDSEKQTSVFQEGSEKGQYVTFQIIKILTGKKEKGRKNIFKLEDQPKGFSGGTL